ncbi:MAG: SOS response-associated peptidase [Pseudomonadota bacterium]
MCGRFSSYTPLRDLEIQLKLERVQAEFRPRYNIPPGVEAPIVRSGPGDGVREAVNARWGLVPSWSREPLKGPPLINARSETVRDKPVFKQAFRSRRCLVPADGFFEWARADKKKTPFFFRLRENRPLVLAGLWELWTGPERDILSFTILTTRANELVAAIHDRMPVIVPPGSLDAWLDPHGDDPTRFFSFFEPFPSEMMLRYQVGSFVNNASQDGPSCVTPVDEEARLPFI